MNKVLIFDKSVFHGTACSKLIDFVKYHQLQAEGALIDDKFFAAVHPKKKG